MAYWFNGFLARPSIERPTILPADTVWREIVAPFVGVGLRVNASSLAADDEPKSSEARRLLSEFGLGSATDWLYLSYVTWAGEIDSVYGVGASGGREFGPVSGSDFDKAQAAYLELMGAFGIAPTDALNFPPFTRGFWGE